jgi:hypothetical protein
MRFRFKLTVFQISQSVRSDRYVPAAYDTELMVTGTAVFGKRICDDEASSASVYRTLPEVAICTEKETAVLAPAAAVFVNESMRTVKLLELPPLITYPFVPPLPTGTESIQPAIFVQPTRIAAVPVEATFAPVARS